MPSIEQVYQMYGQPTTGATGVTSPGGGAGTTEAEGLVSTPAEANLAAAPTLEKLSQMVNQINRQAQVSMIPGGEQLEQQSSQNIQNLLSGQLPTSFTQNLQSSLAQQYGGRGFAPDTGAMNAAALRAMGLQSQQLQSQGEQELSAAYKRFPIYDISQSLLTPSLYTNYLNQKAQQAAEAARLAESRRQYDLTAQQQLESTRLEAQTKLQIAQMQAGQAQAELDEKKREYNATHDTGVLMQINELQQRAAEANMKVGLETQNLNAQVWDTALKYMSPFQSQFEASTQHSLPQYVQTTQIPTVPTQYQVPKMIGQW